MRQCYNSARVAAGSKRKQTVTRRAKPARAAPEGDLARRIRATGERALRSGALSPIDCEEWIIEDCGVRYSVRLARNLERKRTAAASSAERANPFLPYEQELFVAPLGESHVCLLNKFKVLEDHALIVTRSFEDQTSALRPNDFAALATCLRQIDGLGFYNAGPAAGASQKHKHLQLVPGPIGEGPGRVPIEPLLELDELRGGEARVCQGAALPYRHALIDVRDCLTGPSDGDGAALERRYRSLLQATDCDARQPYNLLVTREWMLLVPRKQESSHGVEVNSLGLAGALFARDAEQLSRIESIGPMNLLCEVATSNP